MVAGLDSLASYLEAALFTFLMTFLTSEMSSFSSMLMSIGAIPCLKYIPATLCCLAACLASLGLMKAGLVVRSIFIGNEPESFRLSPFIALTNLSLT